MIELQPSLRMASRRPATPPEPTSDTPAALRWMRARWSLWEPADDTTRVFAWWFMSKDRAGDEMFAASEVSFAASLHGRTVEWIES